MRILSKWTSSGLAGLLAVWLSSSCGYAHDVWADGKRVPDWVKQYCCGPNDVHHLTPEMVHAYKKSEGPKAGYPMDYYIVDGYPYPVDADRALPSQDGDYWIFYSHTDNGFSGVFCFFVPFAG